MNSILLLIYVSILRSNHSVLIVAVLQNGSVKNCNIGLCFKVILALPSHSYINLRIHILTSTKIM